MQAMTHATALDVLLAGGPPLALVFLLFFVLPLLVTLVVSFWNYTDYRSIPAFTSDNYRRCFDGCITSLPGPLRHASNLSVDAEVLPAGLGASRW